MLRTRYVTITLTLAIIHTVACGERGMHESISPDHRLLESDYTQRVSLCVSRSQHFPAS